MNTITEYSICPSDKCPLVIGGHHVYGGNVPYRVNFLRNPLFLQINVPIGYKVIMYKVFTLMFGLCPKNYHISFIEV